MTSTQRCILANTVFDCVFANCETFREDNVGADLAYLLGAITDLHNPNDSFVDWSVEGYGKTPPRLLEIIRREFPLEHDVWRFVKGVKRQD